MVSTVPLDELERHAENLYEAIVVIAKRARQINDEQKRYIEQELGYDSALDNVHSNDSDDELEEVRDERSKAPVKLIKLPKPTTISLEEMMSGKLHYDYAETPEDREN
ncbi:MAG: DNA-directed RNA polymerase subunit omega [candidate division KSB1 bacterium]|nr:DNA-directed RNA polymerase subunit omega [candidate division KSB1 bacterium]MDZ7275470.1 DNA-directed RNA polymerase subunit omega [candidate division KSB1 bacterium]MDZ7286218.1 DNA-directed RNA polymerase subunit omega [candidate division KSB1 bacterium]MDZ7296444.1 DNA-directed RNA polymerase subunit omega [candidate division KSB1 bacterium]MDZ7307240.1 DNA-directed RNA polymerase subunit omega [candidate division KSB1 bacterium]